MTGHLRFRLLVFDWDGTLMDSEARIVDAMRRALIDTGLDPLAPESVRAIIGLGLMEAVAALLPHQDPAIHIQVADRYRSHYLAAEGVPTPLFPCARDVLETLHGQGHLLAVATGKSRRGLERSLAESDLGHLFQTTRCADETRSKPHPQMLLEILDELGVAHGVHPPERLYRQSPLAVLESLAALPDWLAGDQRFAA